MNSDSPPAPQPDRLMREDPDLIRRILQTVADHVQRDGGTIQEDEIARKLGEDPDRVAEHLIMLDDRGLIRGSSGRTSDGPYGVAIDVNTAGHDELDRLQREEAWWPPVTREQLVEAGEFLGAIEPIIAWAIALVEFTLLLWIWLS